MNSYECESGLNHNCD